MSALFQTHLWQTNDGNEEQGLQKLISSSNSLHLPIPLTNISNIRFILMIEAHPYQPLQNNQCSNSKANSCEWSAVVSGFMYRSNKKFSGKSVPSVCIRKLLAPRFFLSSKPTKYCTQKPTRRQQKGIFAHTCKQANTDCASIVMTRAHFCNQKSTFNPLQYKEIEKSTTLY